MTDSEILVVLRRFVEGELLRDRAPVQLTNSTALVSSGLLDSLATVELLAFLDERWGVQLEAHEIDWTMMDTLDALARVVEAKLRSGPA